MYLIIIIFSDIPGIILNKSNKPAHVCPMCFMRPVAITICGDTSVLVISNLACAEFAGLGLNELQFILR